MALGLALATGLAASSASAQMTDRFDGRYMGELVLKAVINDCTPPPLGALYPLTIAGGQVSFAYIPRFATTLSGRVDKNGSFKATARVKSGVVQMTGHTDGYNATAEIVSPSCRYTFQTKN